MLLLRVIMENRKTERLKQSVSPKIEADKKWYLSLLDEGEQHRYEQNRLNAQLALLKAVYISRLQSKISAAKAELEEIKKRENYSAADYRASIEKNAEIIALKHKLNEYRCFFFEPYFARMDTVDEKEGYNSYYIGKKGDVNLEIVDWRAPLAVRYYQKSRVSFDINDYHYRAVLRRALSVKNGNLIGFKNEYLSVKDVLSEEEIAGRDEEILFDPYLRSIIKSRKDDSGIRDIIQTIQEQQFAVVTRPERESFVLQGCAGSGKTMILLHRLSYLMYNNESLRPRDVLVITPSDSFNSFIDELSAVLELQKVRTVTLKNYYIRVLQNEGVDLSSRMTDEKEPIAYLSYLYSPRFSADVKKKIGKIYDGLYGLFAGEECRELAERILCDCAARQEKFVKVKNASLRVRRTVLGELKDDKEGGFYFTKPFRSLVGAYVQAEDFLRFVLHEEPRTPDYFFRRFAEFYRSAREAALNSEKIFAQAERDLAELEEQFAREIADLKRYRRRTGEGDSLTYPDRIAKREEMRAEAAKIRTAVAEMGRGNELFREFFAVIKSSAYAAELGKCRDRADTVRWLYREILKPIKKKYKMTGVYPSDGYAICRTLCSAGRTLLPRYGLVFIDEGQDISAQEYALLREIHTDAAFNIFGDRKQNVTPWRGVDDWSQAAEIRYELNRNYRNTNEIVEFVRERLGAEMSAIGLHGEPVTELPVKKLNSFFKDKQGLKAVIAKEEHLPLFEKKGYHTLSDGKLSKTKVNLMSVFESKGLEFSAVAVYDRDMTENEKYIAYTRALRELVILK